MSLALLVVVILMVGQRNVADLGWGDGLWLTILMVFASFLLSVALHYVGWL